MKTIYLILWAINAIGICYLVPRDTAIGLGPLLFFNTLFPIVLLIFRICLLHGKNPQDENDLPI